MIDKSMSPAVRRAMGRGKKLPEKVEKYVKSYDKAVDVQEKDELTGFVQKKGEQAVIVQPTIFQEIYEAHGGPRPQQLSPADCKRPIFCRDCREAAVCG